MSNPYQEIFPYEVNERLQRRDHIVIVDVREPDEFAEGHIPDAKNIPLGSIPGALNLFDPQQETIVVCQGGGAAQGLANICLHTAIM
ncbi:rhodanese-like domain-containing protein [Paenibacillus sp. D2_2]|uniref:rhodanese-like domain-containing protein n=1 Tax=Paenibacillus sp. D2_2 TaxID=3073092 RepID=UPI0035C09020